MKLWYGLLALALGCHAPAKPVPVEHDAGHSNLVHVDPSLLASGRIGVTKLERRAMRGDIRVSAELVPSESGQADVGSLVSGRIAVIAVKDGDTVKKGELLAWVDSPDATRIAADAIRARARLANATRHLERQLALDAERATSASAIDDARLEVDSARAESGASRTLLAGLGIPDPGASGVAVARVPIRSPIDGVVVERMVVLGASVAPDKTLFRVVATGRVVADVRWTDPLTAIPAAGSRARIVLRDADASAGCEASVTAAVSLVDERTRSRRVRVVPVGTCDGLVAGAYAEVAFDSGERIALALPRAAVVDVRGASIAFVEGNARGTFEPRSVVVSGSSADDVAIASGLAESDRVVTTGAILLKGEMLRAELEP